MTARWVYSSCAQRIFSWLQSIKQISRIIRQRDLAILAVARVIRLHWHCVIFTWMRLTVPWLVRYSCNPIRKPRNRFPPSSPAHRTTSGDLKPPQLSTMNNASCTDNAERSFSVSVKYSRTINFPRKTLRDFAECALDFPTLDSQNCVVEKVIIFVKSRWINAQH